LKEIQRRDAEAQKGEKSHLFAFFDDEWDM